MSGVWDFEQPAKHWIADMIKNLGTLSAQGEEPSMEIEINGVSFEFRIKPEHAIKLDL